MRPPTSSCLQPPPLQTTRAQFVDAMRDITRIWRGRHVPGSGILSEPLEAADVTAIGLPEGDLDSARRCMLGDCAIKLSDAEMARIGRAAGVNEGDWQARTQAAFRSVVLDRLHAYR